MNQFITLDWIHFCYHIEPTKKVEEDFSDEKENWNSWFNIQQLKDSDRK